jgi:hypothetical protein
MILFQFINTCEEENRAFVLLPQKILKGVATITCTIANVTLTWFFHVLKL